jgi:hypothetical protein
MIKLGESSITHTVRSKFPKKAVKTVHKAVAVPNTLATLAGQALDPTAFSRFKCLSGRKGGNFAGRPIRSPSDYPSASDRLVNIDDF